MIVLQLICLLPLAWNQPNVATVSTGDGVFELVDDFDRSKTIFRADTFDLEGYSTDGGTLIAYHSNERSYLVFDVWLFGETGGSHTTYWTDKDLRFKVIKTTKNVYDKPYYKAGYKVTQDTEFYVYGNGVERYDESRKIKSQSGKESTASAAEKLFFAIATDLKLRK
jgi:hypothetical protein